MAIEELASLRLMPDRLGIGLDPRVRVFVQGARRITPDTLVAPDNGPATFRRDC